MAQKLDVWHFARPGLAQGYLEQFKLGLSSARGLFARRRMGKTEFLTKDLLPSAKTAGYLVAYVNLWDNRTAPETAIVAALAEAIEPVGLKKLLKRLAPPPSKVKVSAGVDGLAEGAVEAEFKPGAAGESLRSVLKALDRRKKVLLLVIDEAQVLAKDVHADFAHALRAALDIRKESVKVVFAGSSETTLRKMFASPTAPFYNWAPLEPFPLLDEEFVAFLVNQMNAIAKHELTLKQGEAAFAALNRTPEFFRRFIGEYLTNPFAGVQAAIEDTQRKVFSDAHFVRAWTELNPADRAVLRLIAHGQVELHGAENLARLKAHTGKVATKNTVSHALRRLQEANIITRLALGDYHYEDEAFGEFVRRQPSGPGGAPVIVSGPRTEV
jgi:hypothetical protein